MCVPEISPLCFLCNQLGCPAPLQTCEGRTQRPPCRRGPCRYSLRVLPLGGPRSGQHTRISIKSTLGICSCIPSGSGVWPLRLSFYRPQAPHTSIMRHRRGRACCGSRSHVATPSVPSDTSHFSHVFRRRLSFLEAFACSSASKSLWCLMHYYRNLRSRSVRAWSRVNGVVGVVGGGRNRDTASLGRATLSIRHRIAVNSNV